MLALPKRNDFACLALALAVPLGACSGQTGVTITDAAPGSYDYAKACFRALGLQALTSGSGTPTAQSLMDRASATAIAAGSKQGMEPAAVLTDLLRATGEGARTFQGLSGSEKSEYAAASEAFAGSCLVAQS